MFARYPFLHFLSHMDDEFDKFAHLLQLLQNPPTKKLIEETIMTLLREDDVFLTVHEDRVRISSVPFHFAGFHTESTLNTIAYRKGKLRISVIQHYKSKHEYTIKYPHLPCVVTTGGPIKKLLKDGKITSVNQLSRSYFPPEILQIKIEGDKQRVEEIFKRYAHRWEEKCPILPALQGLPDNEPPPPGTEEDHVETENIVAKVAAEIIENLHTLPKVPETQLTLLVPNRNAFGFRQLASTNNTQLQINNTPSSPQAEPTFPPKSCMVCSNNHEEKDCKMNYQLKAHACYWQRRCELCFQKGHAIFNCKVLICKKCNSTHHKYLCPEYTTEETAKQQEEPHTSAYRPEDEEWTSQDIYSIDSDNCEEFYDDFEDWWE